MVTEEAGEPSIKVGHVRTTILVHERDVRENTNDFLCLTLEDLGALVRRDES